MLKLIKTEIWKLKRYSVVWIGVAAMAAVALLSRFMAMAEERTAYTLKDFSDAVIWNNLTLVFPAVIVLTAGYLVERERTDDTLKNILALPCSFRRLLAGKLLTVLLLAALFGAAEFGFTMILFKASHFQGGSLEAAGSCLIRMILMNLSVYAAVLPIIVYVAQRRGLFFQGVAFAFFYGFMGTFLSGHGLTSLYPVTAGLGIIGYGDMEAAKGMDPALSLCVLGLMTALAAGMAFFARDREKPYGKERL